MYYDQQIAKSNRMKPFFALVLFFSFSICIAQQTNRERAKQNSISVNAGHAQFKEENLHPKVFRGLNIGTLYSHSRTRINISEYAAGLEISFLNTAYEEFPSALSGLILGSYRYLLPVLTNERLTFYFGPAACLQYGTNAYFNWDESHLYFANFISGGIGNRINYRRDKYGLVFNFDIPLVSVISRPKPNRQYKIDDMTFTGVMKNLSGNPELALPDKNFYVKTGLELNFATTKMKMRSMGYNFQYHFAKANKGKPYQNAKHTISYKFIL